MGPTYCPGNMARAMSCLEISGMGPIWVPSGLYGLPHIGPMQINGLGPQMVCQSGAGVGLIWVPYIAHVMPSLEISDEGPTWAPCGLYGLTHMGPMQIDALRPQMVCAYIAHVKKAHVIPSLESGDRYGSHLGPIRFIWASPYGSHEDQWLRALDGLPIWGRCGPHMGPIYRPCNAQLGNQ